MQTARSSHTVPFMDLPAYWMPRPGPGPDASTVAEFDRLLEEAVAAGPGQAIEYRLAAPKWQFLCHAADHAGFVLHGTGEPDIAIFEPRQPEDLSEFGSRRAVFAAMDGIWPMYFAILDRVRYEMGLVNGCIRVAANRDPYYFFSISRSALEQQPWRQGIVYLLPAEGFQAQPPIRLDGEEIQIAQAVNPTAVRPAAKLVVQPEDFPFLHQIRGHDNDLLRTRAAADPDGFPWLDELDA